MYPFEIKEIPGKGRAMISVKAFAKGDVILEEEPLVSCQYSWNSAYGYATCDHCMRPLETITENIRRLSNQPDLVVAYTNHDPTNDWISNFTKCLQCHVRYCSEDCRLEAWRRYHRVACLGSLRNDNSHPINKLNEIWKKMHYPPETGTIMLLVRLIAMYQQSSNKSEFLQSLQSFQSSVINKQDQIYHKMLGVNFEQQMQQLYEAFCEAFQGDNFKIFTTPEAFKALMGLMGINCQGIATSVLAVWSNKVLSLGANDEEKDKLWTYIDDLYHKIDEFACDFLNNEGSGLYILQSKINHSCVPNAESTFPYSNDIVVLKALKSIQSGEEICISYLDECQLNRSRYSRQKILRENYIFLCQCIKCLEQANDPDVTSDDDDDDIDNINDEYKSNECEMDLDDIDA